MKVKTLIEMCSATKYFIEYEEGKFLTLDYLLRESKVEALKEYGSMCYIPEELLNAKVKFFAPEDDDLRIYTKGRKLMNFESRLKDVIQDEVEKALYNLDIYDFINSIDIEDKVSIQVEEYVEDNIDSIVEEILDDLLS